MDSYEDFEKSKNRILGNASRRNTSFNVRDHNYLGFKTKEDITLKSLKQSIDILKLEMQHYESKMNYMNGKLSELENKVKQYENTFTHN